MNKTSPKVFRLLTMEDSGDAQHVVDEDMKTASTIIMVSAVQLIGVFLLITLLCLAKRIKARLMLKLEEERDKPPPYQPPPSFTAAMKMSREIQPSGDFQV